MGLLSTWPRKIITKLLPFQQTPLPQWPVGRWQSRPTAWSSWPCEAQIVAWMNWLNKTWTKYLFCCTKIHDMSSNLYKSYSKKLIIMGNRHKIDRHSRHFLKLTIGTSECPECSINKNGPRCLWILELNWVKVKDEVPQSCCMWTQFTTGYHWNIPKNTFVAWNWAEHEEIACLPHRIQDQGWITAINL